MNDGSVTAAKLSSMGAGIGQILKYNGTAWVPTTPSSTQLYRGGWNATTNSPNANASSPALGDYYIVTTPGTYNLGTGATAYAVGDWILYNGTSWDKIANSTNGVTSFKTRVGAVVPTAGDYVWADITKTGSKIEDIANVDITARADGDILIWNTASSKWISTAFTSVPAAGSIVNSQLANSTITYAKLNFTDGDIPQAKVNGLVTALAAKEGTLTVGTSTQYYRGDKTWATLSTNNVTENTNLYFTNARVLGVALTGLDTTLTGTIAATDTVLQAFGKTQAQINSIGTGSSAYVTKTGTSTVSGTIDARTGFVLVGTPGTANDATPKTYVDTQVATAVAKSGDTMTGDLTVNTLVKLKDSGTNFVSVKAPATVGTSYNFILPTSAGTSGYVLKTDGSGNLSWVDPTTVNPGSGTVAGASIVSGSITDTQVSATANIAQSKISGLSTSLSGKEGTITAGTTAQYYRGDKTWSTLATDVGTAVLSAYTVGTNAVLAATDSVNSAFGKIQAQLNNKEGTVTAGTTAQYYRGDKTWSTFASDVLSSVVSTFSLSGTTKPTVTTTDTVSGAFGKVQKYINDIDSDYVSKSDGTVANTVSGVVAFNSIGSLKIGYTPTNATDATSKAYVDSVSGNWQTSGSNIYRSNGNVGIGTASPSYSLEVQRDAIGSTYTNSTASFINTTAATSGLQQGSFLHFGGNTWASGASAGTDMWMGLDPSRVDNPLFVVYSKRSGSAATQILNIDSYGQFQSPLRFAYWDARQVVNYGLTLTNDAGASATYNEYSAGIRMHGSGWKTASTAGSQYMSIGNIVAPETGVTNPIGVWKQMYGTNSISPTETNELFRYEWGDRLGATFNKLNLSGYTTSFYGNVGMGGAASQVQLDVTGSARIGTSPTTVTTSPGAITNTDTTLTVTSTTGYPTSGYLYIYIAGNSELLSYTGVTATTFTGVTRGIYSTTALSLAAGATVDLCLLCVGNTNTTPKLVVSQAHGIGIGAAPPGWQQADSAYIKGNLYVLGSYIAQSYYNYGTSSVKMSANANSTSADYWSLSTNSLERLRIDGSGNVGIGTVVPLGVFAVNPSQYSTGTASQSGTTITGTGTNFTSAMIGSQFVFTSGTNAGTITAVASTTSLTVTISQTLSARAFSINYNGFNVTSTGLVGIGTVAPTAALTVNGPIVSLQNSPTIAGSSPTWTSTLAFSTTSAFSLNPSTAVANDTIALTFSGTPANGASYMVSLKDPVVMSVSFTAASCGTIKYKPASTSTNVITTTGTGGTLITMTTIYNGTNYDCYVTWASGYQ